MTIQHHKPDITMKSQLKLDTPSTWAPWFVFFIALTFQFFAFEPLINVYDEGIVLLGAELVSDGKIPYRDFWTMYGPGQFYLTSWLFSVFGHTDLVVRTMGMLEKAIITSLSYVIISRLAPKAYSIAATAIILFMLISAHLEAFPAFPALTLALVSVLLAEKGLHGKTSYMFLAGISTGLAASFRHDLGLYSALGISISSIIVNLLQAPSTRHALYKSIRQIIIYGAGTLAVFAPIMAFLLYTVPLADLYENLIYIPSKIYPAVRSIPFPKLHALLALDIPAFVVYVPFILVVSISITELYTKAKKKKTTFRTSDGNESWVLIPMILITCLLFTLKGMVRVSSFHMIQALVFSVILLAAYFPRINWKSKPDKFVLLPSFLLATALLASTTFSGAIETVDGAFKIIGGKSNVIANCTNPVLPRMRCVGIDNDYLSAAKVVMKKTQPNDKIYVGTTRHDKLFANAVTFYFVAERQPAVKWHDLHPGVQSQERIQLQMIGQMRESPPKIVVLDSRWDDAEEPNDSRLANGSKLLDSYIQANYKETQRFGTVQVLEPR